MKRQKKSNILKITQWALYRKFEFKSLIEDISSLIDNIERIFSTSQAQITLIRQKATQLHDRDDLDLIQSAAADVNNLLQNAVKEAFSDH